jgi:hypothetical protein
MMHLSKHVLALLALGISPVRVFAADPTKAPANTQEKPQQERVHLGSASVTVVDEHEAVDDVITRIRTGKKEAGGDKTGEATKSVQDGQTATATPTVNKDSGRASLRVARERANARNEGERRKDERRERAAAARAHSEQKRR